MDLSKRRVLDKEYVADMVGEPVKSYTVSAGANKGDNVIGMMLALEVQTEGSETLKLVVKSLIPLVGDVNPASLSQVSFINEIGMYPGEILYYNNVRPLLNQATGGRCSLYKVPKIYSSHSDKVNDYIALEDLRPQGYKMADKRAGLNPQQVNITLSELAYLHAHSYAMLQAQNPDLLELLNSSTLNTHIWNREVFGFAQKLFFDALAEKMCEVLKETGEQEMGKRADKFLAHGYQIMMDLWKKSGTSSKYFRVVIHGDLWANNILFKYAPDGVVVEDVKFVDFQQCRFGNIYEDLQYFLFTSTTVEFRRNHLKPCLAHYFRSFAAAVQDLNASMPANFTEESLIATFYENIEYGFSYNAIAIPFQLVESGPAPPENGVKGESNSDDGNPQLLLQSGQEASTDYDTMMRGAAEMMKLGTLHSPLAIQRLKEMTREMIKLNII